MPLLTAAPVFVVLLLLFLMCVSSSEQQSGVKTIRVGVPDPLRLPKLPWTPGSDKALIVEEDGAYTHKRHPLLAGQGSSNVSRPEHGETTQTRTCRITGILQGNRYNGKLSKAPAQLIFDMDSCRGKHRRIRNATLMLVFHRNFNTSCNFLLRTGSSRPPHGRTHPHFKQTLNVRKGQKASPCRVKYNIRKTAKWCLAHPRGACILGLELPREIAGDEVWGEAVIDGSPATAESRTRRQAVSEICDETEPHCCRRTMRVSFQDIGWSEWIMAPKEYDAYYCGGSCPPKHRAASAHTKVKMKMQQISRGATPQTCCVPAAYRPLTVMTFNSKGQLTLSVLENMIVSECKCT
ncbi:growth/differentiation factor 9-like [Megalops cyprinoides]|uniref:growth/differentiation factor 9-like n=1 Tax=Megalops cyprinoides TaxID=118141 RepID=UPI001864ACA7|nr:growth/differentiation factor 9-like [Megalops cyprinoides]